MQTLSQYEKQFQDLFNISEPNGNIIDVSKHSFTKGQYNLLNKNLIFPLHVVTIIKVC